MAKNTPLADHFKVLNDLVIKEAPQHAKLLWAFHKCFFEGARAFAFAIADGDGVAAAAEIERFNKEMESE